MASPYLTRPLRSLAEVEAGRAQTADVVSLAGRRAVSLCEGAGLHHCINQRPSDIPMVCGCVPGRCADRPQATREPFAPGDRVLLRRSPFEALTVVRCEPLHRGDGFAAVLRLGVVPGREPAAELILAPDGWRDAPMPPAGSVQVGGLDEAGWRAKRAQDASDPEYRAAWRDFCRARVEWAREHLARVDAALAKREIAGFADRDIEVVLAEGE